MSISQIKRLLVLQQGVFFNVSLIRKSPQVPPHFSSLPFPVHKTPYSSSLGTPVLTPSSSFLF